MGLKRHLTKYELAYFGSFLFGSMFAIPLGGAVYQMCQWRNLGEGYTVKDSKNERIFGFGNSRFGKDKDKNGTLDEVLINMPVSPMMGGPGYRTLEVPMEREDRTNFAKAEDLLKLEKPNHRGICFYEELSKNLR